MNSIKTIIGLVLVAVLFFGCTGQAQSKTENKIDTKPMPLEKENKTGNDLPKNETVLEEPQEIAKPQVIDTSPMSGEIYAKGPRRVVVNTNFDLAKPSEITVFANDKKASLGETKFPDKTTMEVTLNEGLQDGTYRVMYSACEKNGSCIRDEYTFTVDKARLSEYTDWRNKKYVTVSMKDFAFEPQKVRISPGTVVTFLNDGKEVHFVNSDPHPSHTFLRDFNSLDIESEESWEFTFNEMGEIHYHCSAHVPQAMFGRIIVEGNEVVKGSGEASVEVGSGSTDPFSEKETTIDFSQIRAAHFVSSNPSHQDTVKEAAKVSINFNFNLHEKSRITVTRNGNPVNGQTNVVNDLTLETPLNTNLPGTYVAEYIACWPDGSCHQGKFGFTIE